MVIARAMTSQTGYNIPPPLIKENEVRSFLIIPFFNIAFDRIQLYMYIILYNYFYFPIYYICKLNFYLNFSISLPR